MLDAKGVSSFSAPQDSLSADEPGDLTFYAFDLLYLDGWDLGMTPLLERKTALASLLEAVVTESSPVQYSNHVLGNGPGFFAEAARLSLEGIVSKRVKAAYRPGKSRSWLKTKCFKTGEFVIVGFTESKAARGYLRLPAKT